MPTFEEIGLPARNRTVLVIEDNDINREMLSALLEGEYHVIQAANGKEGLEQMQRHLDDLSLVLLDVYMPVMDGFEFLKARQGNERYGNIPTIVVTASNTIDDEIACLELGANDFVSKPYNAQIILTRVRNTIRMRESASIINQLRWDVTTGLYREDFFYRRVNNVLLSYPHRAFDLVCCDIRNFKTLNERYGRESCDHLLHDLAHRLLSTIPGVVASGRIGGDSFGFLIEHQADDWTKSLDPAVRSLEYASLYVRFGIVSDVDHELGASLLCDRATIAIEELRDSVGAGVAWYDDALGQRQAIEHALVEDFESALQTGQFMVYYQPKNNVHTGKIAGAEALVRWLHPKMGFVRPDTFIPVFERNGLITRLDRYVCNEACREIARMQAMGLPVVPISVNMSPLDFDDPDLPKHVLELADKHKIDHDLLHLELTETAYTEDSKTVIDVLNELRSHGFKIELDDFGSGYSSLALLNIIPLDILKIDGGMVRHAARKDDFRIVQLAIQIAQMLNLETVIEGVETADALERLRDMGCDLIQGFYFSWPLRRDDFEEYVQTH